MAQSKAQLLTEVHTVLKRRYKMEPRASKLSVLESVIYGICHEDATREQANQAMSRFRDEFYDWNEVRVSGLEEIQGVFAGLPDPEGRAQRLRRFLRQLFEKTYGFNLDPLAKKPLKEAIKALREYEALQSDYVLATVIQLGLNGHAIPVDAPIRRGLGRLSLAEHQTETSALRAALERQVPKNRGVEFVDLMEELTHDTCVEGEPDCPRCDLRKICPTGHARMTAPPKARGGAKGKVPAKGKAAAVDGRSSKPAPAARSKAAPSSARKPAAAKTSTKSKPRRGK